MKSYTFDVEMIIDHEITTIRGETVKLCTHRVIRCLNERELRNLIKDNQAPDDSGDTITLNIRGVTI